MQTLRSFMQTLRSYANFTKFYANFTKFYANFTKLCKLYEVMQTLRSYASYANFIFRNNKKITSKHKKMCVVKLLNVVNDQMCVNTLFVCHVISLCSPVVRRPRYAGGGRREQVRVGDRIAGANMWKVRWVFFILPLVFIL